MNWMNKMERKFGKYAIPNLMTYIIVLYAVGLFIQLVNPAFYHNYLSLSASAILHGQIWRIVTFLIFPPDGSLLFIIFAFMLYYMIGRNLEFRWGAFRFNLYFFTGVLLHVIAAILVYVLFGLDLPLTTAYLNLSLFFAFAVEFPDVELLLFFIIPIKIKWLALVDGIYFGVTIIAGFLAMGGLLPASMIYNLLNFGIVASPVSSVAALVSLGNFVLFFLLMQKGRFRSPKQIKRKVIYQSQVKAAAAKGKPRHKCAICGRTEMDGDDLEFRYCSKCEGTYEYCQDHLYTHKHVTKGS